MFSVDINPVVVDHREGTGKPAISAEGFSRFPRTLLVARCHSRELQAGKAFDRGNVRYARPALFGVCTDDSDTNLFLHAFLPAAAVAAEGVRTNAALTVRLGIATSGLAVAAERLASPRNYC
jgi:hypothetical protein